MARNTKKKSIEYDWENEYANGGIDRVDLSDEILKSMQSYIDYTLVERALPYIDGCKPVIKASLWAAWKLGLKPSSGYLKSATLSSDVVGHYHAHNGAAVYGAIAGSTRENGDDTRGTGCSIQLSLFDGHGSWGDTAPEAEAAADRYTEVKLSKTGANCIKDTASGAVFMLPSFDAKSVLPQLMPSHLPLLLINGSDGLAYGYNVSWLPHNPSEAIQACIHRIENPKCTPEDIRKIMPGPDFPSGGIVIDRSEGGLKEVYATGFGNISVCARYEIVQGNRGKHMINIYQSPFKVPHSSQDKSSGGNSILGGLIEFAKEHPEYGIVDVKNLSDYEHECFIEVSIKAGIDPNIVAAAIMDKSSKTHLNETVSYRQSVVLGDFIESPEPDATGVEGVLKLTNPVPRDTGMLEYIDAFIDFRVACNTNAGKFERNKAMEQKHLIDGMLTALIDIDKIIEIVRQSKDKEAAKKGLMKHFKLDDVQADYILAIPLSRLTKSDKIQLEGNSKSLAAKIKSLNKMLSSRKNLIAETKRQLEEELEQQSLPRRTTIVNARGKIVAKAHTDKGAKLEETKGIISTLFGEKVSLPMSSEGETSNIAAPQLKMSGKTTVYLTNKGEIASADKDIANYVYKLIDIDMEDNVLVVYADGSSTRIKGFEVPAKAALLGKKAVGIAKYDEQEPVNIVMTTSDGKVKVLDASTLTKNPDCDVIKVSSGAEVLSARPVVDGDQQVVFVASNANLLKFPASSVPVQGRTSTGVAGFKLVKDSKVIGAFVADEGDMLITNTGKSIKVTPLSEYPVKGRGSQGVRSHKFLSGEEALIGAYIGSSPRRSDKKALPKPAARDASGTKQQGLGKIEFSE